MNVTPMRFYPAPVSELHCRGHGGKSAWTTIPRRKKWCLARWMSRGACAVWWDWLWGAREKEAHKATLFGMYVPSSCRGRGIGAQLVQTVLAEARARQLHLVQLTVTQGNAAAEYLYAAQGFEVFGVEPMALRLGDEFFNKVHMWCALRE